MNNKLNSEGYESVSYHIDSNERDSHDMNDEGSNGLVIFIALIVLGGIGSVIVSFIPYSWYR